jgi:hypothetical protein
LGIIQTLQGLFQSTFTTSLLSMQDYKSQSAYAICESFIEALKDIFSTINSLILSLTQEVSVSKFPLRFFYGETHIYTITDFTPSLGDFVNKS